MNETDLYDGRIKKIVKLSTFELEDIINAPNKHFLRIKK